MYAPVRWTEICCSSSWLLPHSVPSVTDTPPLTVTPAVVILNESSALTEMLSEKLEETVVVVPTTVVDA